MNCCHAPGHLVRAEEMTLNVTELVRATFGLCRRREQLMIMRTVGKIYIVIKMKLSSFMKCYVPSVVEQDAFASKSTECNLEQEADLFSRSLQLKIDAFVGLL